jgi:hypothetical protein
MPTEATAPGGPFKEKVMTRTLSILAAVLLCALTFQDPIQVTKVPGVNGQRFSIQSAGTGSAEVQLVPGNTKPNGRLNSQIQWFGVSGDNYERFCVTAVGNIYVIDTTARGTGAVRNISFQAQGTSAGTNQNALTIYGDTSVDLNGAAYKAGGVAFGATRTRIADWTNTGDSRLVLDTRTGTPSDDVADSSSLEFRRGGKVKWETGLNVSGANRDTMDFRVAGQGNALSLTQQQSVLLGQPNPGTKATDGFPYLPASPGAPKGVPAAKPGFVPVYYDTANHKLWIYDGGWKGVAVR